MVLTFDPLHEFDRLAGQMFGGAGGARVPQAMPMDLYRSGDHYVAHFELPGIDPGSVDISIEGSVMTIRAERSARTKDGVHWLRRERLNGTFQRQLSLGDQVDLDHITATYSDGVLTLTIPVAEQAKPRRVPVTVGSGRMLEGTSGETRALDQVNA